MLLSRAPIRWFIALVLSILALWFGSLARNPVKDGPLSIVVLELAPTVDRADRFMRAWQAATANWQEKLEEAQRWDTGLICVYAPLFALLCWIAADHVYAKWRRFGVFGYRLAIGQLIAGGFDFVENWGLQKTIVAGHATAPWPSVTATASAIKWALILLFVLYILTAALCQLGYRLSRRPH